MKTHILPPCQLLIEHFDGWKQVSYTIECTIFSLVVVTCSN
jgi:hypothetical protein